MQVLKLWPLSVWFYRKAYLDSIFENNIAIAYLLENSPDLFTLCAYDMEFKDLG